MSIRALIGWSVLFCVLVFGAEVPQKLADKPKDMAIKINYNKNSYCYSPSFIKGEGYIYIDDCSTSDVAIARYDVFGRIAYEINDNWLCLSAPSSVTGIDGESTQEWDYIVLRPCVINDKNQRWIIKNNAFYTADERFRIKHYEWYAYISKDFKDYYNHTLDSSMQDWANTIATPGNISIKTPLIWTFMDSSQWAIYYVQNNKSTLDDAVELYYNPENGHIAQYYANNGSLYCMTSNTTTSQKWNWVSWNYCSDKIPKDKDNMYLEFFSMIGNQGTLRDYEGNILRVTQYGSNWGVPYFAKPDYLQKDTTNTPKSLFIFSNDIDKWNRYVDGNLGDTLQYCPAPGKNMQTLKTRVKKGLPPSFELSNEWIRRLWEIATTSDGTDVRIGICGTCLLQSYQMVGEIQEYYLQGPLQSGGYFFDTASGRNPFVSFRQRFPLLARRIEDAMALNDVALRQGEDVFTRTRRVTQAISLAILPQYNWHASNVATTQSDIESLIQSLLNARAGTLWIYSASRSDSAGNRFAHAQPILRTQDGLVLIPTSTSRVSFDVYRTYFNPASNVEETLEYLTFGGALSINWFVVFEMTGLYENPMSLYMSQNNCTGDGEDRRGNTQQPRSSSINQCLSRRCLLQ